jgi:RHS repeat-associated protein
LQQADRYHDIPASGFGTLSTNFYRSIHQYDTRGRQQYEIQVVSGTATSNSREQVTQSVYDVLNRIIEVKKGVSGDSAANQHDMGSSYTSYPTLRSIAATVFDGGGVGDGYVTKEKRYHGTGTNDFTGANYHRNFRGHLRGVEPFYMNGSTETAIGPFTVHDATWIGLTTSSANYTANLTWTSVVADDDYAETISTNRRTLVRSLFDPLNRACVHRTYSVSSSGVATNYLRTDYFRDRNDRIVAIGHDGGAATEFAYDGAGRRYESRTVSQVESPHYDYVSGAFQYRDPKPNPSIASVTGGNDLVFSFVHSTLDSFGNTTETHSYEMVHNDTTPVGLDISANQHVRRSVFRWFDLANRVTAEADYGTDDATSGAGSWKYAVRPTRPASAPTVSSDSTLLTKYEYHVDSGRPDKTTIWSTASKAHVTKTFVDDLGRQTFVAENFDNFSPPSSNTGDTTDKSKDKVTAFEYHGLDQVAKLIAKDPDADGTATDDEVTLYLFEDTVNASLATNEIYPDSTDTTSGGYDQVAMVYNVDGSLSQRKGQGTSAANRTIIDFTYNNRRHKEFEKAMQLLSGVDGGTRSIKREYDTLARLEKVTSYSDTAGSGTVLNQIQFEYNDLSLVSKSHQSHQSAVVIGTTPAVQYGYDTTVVGNSFTRNHRLQQVTYPNGRLSWFGYNEGTADSVQNRLSLIREIKKGSGGTQYTVYDHNGNGRLAIADYPAPDVKLDYFQGTTGTYAGFDRYGRVKDQFWDGYNATSDVSRVKHGYDYAGNRLWREDIIAAAQTPTPKYHDELYTYDGLHRLTKADRGDLNVTYSAVTSKNFGQEWTTLDALGNWSNFKQDNDGNGTWELNQTRTHNKANALSTATSWATSAHDHAGNMTTAPDPANLANSMFMVYDGWNRLVKVSDQGLNILGEYEYDGLNRRIVKIDRKANPDVTYDYYLNELWQTLEVRKDAVTTPLEEYVWHPYYVDALAVRGYDADTSGAGAQVEHYYAHDANFNVVSVFGNTGTVLDRYQYSPYGVLTVLDPNFSLDADNLTDIANSTCYTGRQFDGECGLCYYRYRCYHGHVGRFVSRDPIKYEAGMNEYAYVRDRPLIESDPYGLAEGGVLQIPQGEWVIIVSDKEIAGNGAEEFRDALEQLRDQGENADRIIVKGHANSEGVFDDDGVALIQAMDVQEDDRIIIVGGEEGEKLLEEVTDDDTVIELRGCSTATAAGCLADQLDGATVRGTTIPVIGIPGTPWIVGPTRPFRPDDEKGDRPVFATKRDKGKKPPKKTK